MRSKQRAKKTAPEAEQEISEADRPLWFLGRELKDKPAADNAEKPAGKPLRSTKKSSAAAAPPQPVDEETGERRPSQLEAYMRYAKMREPRDDEFY